MKILSFKKISLIDVILGLTLILGLIFFILFFRRQNTFINIRVKVTDPNVLYLTRKPDDQYAHAFLIGDTEKNEIGEETAKIINIDKFRSESQQQTLYLELSLKANYNPRRGIYTVKGRPIVFGQPMTFTFSNVKVEALVVDYPGFRSDAQAGSLVVKAQLRYESRDFSDVVGVPAYLANSVKKGDKVFNSKGETLAEILEVDIKPAKRIIISQAGKSIAIQDQELKDVYLTIKIKTLEVDGMKYVYDYLPILIGNSLPLNFKDVSIWPTITEILDET